MICFCLKDLERCESYQALNEICGTPGRALNDSKKFGSLDSLATIANAPDLNNTFAPQQTCNSLTKINLPKNKHYAIWISFYELYNDSVYDLLTLKSSKNFRATAIGGDRPQLKIREDNNKVPYVENLTYIPITNTREAIKVLKYGEKNLQKSSNSINLNSSRSHAVFCLKVVSLEETSSTDKSQYTASINQ